jgi:hypothetical protein
MILIEQGADSVEIARNTFVGDTSSFLYLLGQTATALNVHHNAFSSEGSYGIFGDPGGVGTPGWTARVDAASVFSSNLIGRGAAAVKAGRKIAYPAGNTVTTDPTTDYPLDAQYGVVTKYQPLAVGADFAGLVANIAGLDLAKD